MRDYYPPCDRRDRPTGRRRGRRARAARLPPRSRAGASRRYARRLRSRIVIRRPRRSGGRIARQARGAIGIRGRWPGSTPRRTRSRTVHSRAPSRRDRLGRRQEPTLAAWRERKSRSGLRASGGDRPPVDGSRWRGGREENPGTFGSRGRCVREAAAVIASAFPSARRSSRSSSPPSSRLSRRGRCRPERRCQRGCRAHRRSGCAEPARVPSPP